MRRERAGSGRVVGGLDDERELEGASTPEFRLGGAASTHQPSQRLRDGETQSWKTQANEDASSTSTRLII